MKISELYEKDAPVISCEFYSPKTDKGYESLLRVFGKLAQVNPSFFSVTYGAGGTTAHSTLELVEIIQNKHSIIGMPHLTCVNHPKAYIADFMTVLKRRGLENLLALRGDMPGGKLPFVPMDDGFSYASEVVELAAGYEHFCVGVAGHPEGHPESLSLDSDMTNLKHKVDAGAHFILTQFFFDNAYYFEFVDRAQSAGITVPIVPGIILFVNATHALRFAKLNGTNIPNDLQAKMIAAEGDREKSIEVSVEQAISQCSELLSKGVRGIHFYTLNNSVPTIRVMTELGLI